MDARRLRGRGRALPRRRRLTIPAQSATAYNPDRHLGLVTSTWLHTYRQSAWAKLMHPATYTQAQRGVIEVLLRYRGLRPHMLTAADGEVIAWSLWEYCSAGTRIDIGEMQAYDVPARVVLHYLWVAQPIRRCGFASRILREHGADRSTVVSHWSHPAQAALDTSANIRQLFSTSNSHHPRFCPTLAGNPDAFVAM